LFRAGAEVVEWLLGVREPVRPDLRVPAFDPMPGWNVPGGEGLNEPPSSATCPYQFSVQILQPASAWTRE
ncbi:hypothetical protein NPIL_286501, partial [Nephila pilipes]